MVITLNHLSIMKKILCMLAVALTMAGCTNNEQIAESKDNSILNLGFAKGVQDSRTSIGVTDNVLTWKAGDQLQVWSDTETEHPYNLVSGAGTSFGTFQIGEGEHVPEGIYGVFFPREWDGEHQGDVMIFNLDPNLDQTEEGNLDLPMWLFGGYIDNENPENNQMEHIAGVLKVTLTNIPEGYKQMIVESDKQLHGRFTFITNASPCMEGAIDPEIDDAAFVANSKFLWVNFTPATVSDNTAVLYIPLTPRPMYSWDSDDKYGFIKISISNGNSSEDIVLKEFTDCTIERGKVDYTTIDCSSPL